MARPRGRLILGINSAYHESAAAIVRDGEVVRAIEEERFTRIKHAKTASVFNPDLLPWNAIRACLQAVPGATLRDLTGIGYSLEPGRRLALIGGDPYEIDDETGFGSRAGEEEFNTRVMSIPYVLASAAGDDSLAASFHFVPHHLAHAASAFHASPFRSAAALVVDGIGETSTAWLGRGSPQGLVELEQIPYPHSIGMLWERVAVYLGFTEFDACKVMGLAAYGDPERFRRQFDRLFPLVEPDGGRCGGEAGRHLPSIPFWHGSARGMCTAWSRFLARGGRPMIVQSSIGSRMLRPGCKGAPTWLFLRLRDAWLARPGKAPWSTQAELRSNCLSNSRLEREGPFDSLFMPGAAHDAGTAIGAALAVAHEGDGVRHERMRMVPRARSPFLGLSYDHLAIDAAIARSDLAAEIVADPAVTAASLVADGQVVGWFQGRDEFGPRALGSRSLLADPGRAEIRTALNRRIKHRESFRPFGASVLAEDAADWFQIPGDRPGAACCRQFMIIAYPVCPARADLIPAVLHHDGTCRLQVVDARTAPLFHTLITRFRELTGVPMVLNTSFNDREPLVATPDDALKTFSQTHIDALFLGDRLVRQTG